MTHIEIMKFCQNHWSLLTTFILYARQAAPSPPSNVRPVDGGMETAKPEAEFMNVQLR
jgi:hypothetical protein